MPAWLIWLIVAVGFLVAEMFSLELVLLMFALGSLAAAGAAFLGGGVIAQAFTFAGVSILTLILIRPLARPLLRQRYDKAKTGIDALLGTSAIVLRRVDEFSGRIKVAMGEEWSARSVDPADAIEPGEAVIVEKIQGATALVRRRAS